MHCECTAKPECIRKGLLEQEVGVLSNLMLSQYRHSSCCDPARLASVTALTRAAGPASRGESESKAKGRRRTRAAIGQADAQKAAWGPSQHVHTQAQSYQRQTGLCGDQKNRQHCAHVLAWLRPRDLRPIRSTLHVLYMSAT